MYDFLIIGSGPAGISAAISARSKNKTALIISNAAADSPLARAERIDNYPGLMGITGKALVEQLNDHAAALGVDFLRGKVLTAMDMGESWFLTVGQDVVEGRCLIVASGVTPVNRVAGEERLLGCGVSYCAICDGILYRGKKVVVIGRSGEAPAEAAWLASIGCEVIYTAPKRPEGLSDAVTFLRGVKLEIIGQNRVEGVMVDSTLIPCDGVFLLRTAIAPVDLFPELALKDGFIVTDRQGRTNLPRLYAAGDCTGRPFQIAKAVGEGQVAALTAVEESEELGIRS